MKRLLLAVAVFMAACSNEVEEQFVSPASHPTFHAYLEEADTRTYLDEDIRLRWTADDRITLFEGTTRNKQYMFMGETGDNAGEFEFVKAGFGTGNDLDRYYAVYPYAAATKYTYGSGGAADYISYTFPATQTYVAGSVGLGANPMVAITADLEDFDLSFRNVGSYLLVKLYGAEQTVGSISMTTIGGEPLAGKAAIYPVYGSTPSMTMLESNATVTLNCGDGGIAIGTTKETATPFWIVIPSFTATQGIRITVNGYYGGLQSYEVANEIVFNRNKYKTLTRELTIASSDTNMGVGGWGDGEETEGSAE
ncbi:MAG: hypothetical protein IKU77_06175 [Alistipes sp.]|nr:hypothetical protein [Alistipes sp.]